MSNKMESEADARKKALEVIEDWMREEMKRLETEKVNEARSIRCEDSNQ